MTVFEVVPHVGVEPVRLGMTRDEVHRVMPGPCKSFRKTPLVRHETDAYLSNGFQVFYGGESPVVNFIELSSKSGFKVLFRGVDVFATPADRLVALVASESPFDPKDRELGYTYIFPDLELSLWRPSIPTSPEDPDGREFRTIGVGAAGYYSRRP